MVQTYKNNRSKISLWLSRDLARILKDQSINLNQELRKFFQQRGADSYLNVEVTLDSYPEIQKMMKLLSEFDDEATRLLRYVSLFRRSLISVGTRGYYNDFDFDEENEDKSCDRLSAYFAAFRHSPQEMEKLEKKTNCIVPWRKIFL